ncbi:hypothetical protein [Novosphingobium panipatense]|uniref:Uncharacterized protein n=1 Tax=Novosphingobium panipatense TaxID=428991 RepID=A0ABY1Q4T0_9SPHN|nr:hypothetical protein [Novosphingobium panipatense]SMP58427.1 hypothetical protein SAMN06296065_102470 [Novosphingobium panipatense]
MTTFPVRRLGSTGLVPDVFPPDLENVSALSGGVNVRFANGRVSRGPVYRSVADLPHEPGHLLAIPMTSVGYEEVVSVSHDYGQFLRLNGQAFEDLTPPGHLGGDSTQTVTSSFLGGVAYVNRESHAPMCKRSSDNTFIQLPGWPEADRCVALRPYRDQMVALGVTKAGAYIPTMVRWSDFAYFGEAPASWDPTDTTKSAGENMLNEMMHPLVDGLTLRDNFILYCTSSTWMMSYVGGNDIYVFRKLFDDRGMINANCAVQVGGMHYVFDRNDIYVHDGASDRSICDGRTKDFIFRSLNFAKANLCFVQHDAKLSEVRFSYVADDPYSGFRGATTGCNRQAVYNYSNDTWTFYDVPNIVSCTRAALLSGSDWEDDQATSWSDAGGLWMTTEGDEDQHALLAARSDPTLGLSQARIYGQELINGGRLKLDIAPETIRPAMVERTGIDLDAYGKRLTQHVNVQAIWPQLRLDRWQDCSFQFGAANVVSSEPEWGPEFQIDPTSETRIDLNEAGKYVSWRFHCRGQQDFDLHSFDIQLLVRGRR